MKTVIMTLLALALAAPAVFAENAAPPKGQERPCLKIEQACQAAGFMPGGAKEGKGIIVDCVKPLLAGKSVVGVTIEPATLQACQDNFKASRAKDNIAPNQSK